MPLPGFLEEIRERMESRGIPFIALPIAVIAVIAGVAAYFLFFAAPTSTAFKLTVLSSGDAVGGAVVEVYDDAGNLLDSVVTDEAGLASFTRLPAQRVKFTISKTGFEQYERLLDLHRLVSAKVDLAVPEGPTPTAAAPTPSVAPLVVPPAPADKKSEAEFEAREVPKYGELVVQVRDEEGNTLDALVFVHDADTGTQLDSKKASKGTASFSGIQVGTKVAVSARLTGYLSYPDSKGEDNKFFIRDQPTASDVVLKKTTAEDSGETQILVADDSLKPVSGASVSVYIVGELAPVDENKTDARGKYALNLSAGVSYYAMALKKGLLPNFSIAFGAGENVSITLSKPTANNSASLAVNSTDEYMKPLQSTAVVFTEFGERLAEPKETGPGGVAVFDNLPRDWTVVARASAGNKYGSEKVVLDNATRQANIVLDVHYANLTLQALDAMTEKPVGVPKFTVFWRNALIAECAGQNCTATVKSDTELAVEARATGYFTTNWTVEAAAGNTTRATITMIPSGTDKDSFVNLKKIYEKGSPSLIVYERGTIPTTDFLRGHTYIADLEFFAKAGADEGWMVARTSGWITWHSPNTPLFKGGASAAGTACAGADSPWAADGLSYANSLKWIAAGIQPEESQSIPVRMELQTDQQGTEKKFVLELASFEKTGEKYSRNPFDAGLGVAKDAEEKGWCQAQAAQFNFSIKEPNMACDGNACLEVVYRQGSAYLCGPGTDRLDCSGAYAESGPKAGALAAEWKLNVLAKPTGAQKIEFTGAGVKNHSWVNYYDMEELACKALPCASIDVSKLSFPYLNPFEPEASGSFEIDAATIAAGTTSLALSFKHAAGTVTKTTRLGFARLGVEWFKHGTTTPCDPLKEGEAKDCSVMSVNGGKQLIEVFFKQEAAEGGNLFAAQAKRTMAINYSVADEDGGTADFSLSWASPCLEKEYEPASKKFSGKTAEGKASGELAATPSCGTAPDSPVEITLSYKDLIYSTELAIQETVVPPAAPSVYELRYAPSDAAEPMKVFCLNPADKATCACRTPAEALPGAECAVDAIDFTVSGVFPADAVFLLLNWSASPKRDVPPFWKELDDAKCFAIENEENKFPDITGYSASTGMQTVLLKFNAFNPGCTLYKETKGFTTAQIQPRALKPFSYSVIAGAGAPIAFKELPVSLSWDRNAPDVIVVPASDYLAEKDMLKFNMVEDTPDFTKRLWLLIYNAQGTENAPAKTLAVSTTDGAYRISLPATAPQITVFATASRSADFVVSEKIGDDWLTPETALATQGSLYGIESLGQAASLNQLPAMSSALLFHRGNIKVGDVQRGFPFAAFSKDDAVLEMPTDSFTRAAKWEQCDYAKYGGQGVYQITYTARKRDETGNDAFDQSAVGKLKYLGKNALFDTSGLAQTYLDSGDELCGYGYVECGPALLVLSQKPFEQLENVFDDGAIVADEYGSVDQPVPQPYRFHMHKDTCILVKYVGWGRKVIRAAEDRVMYWQVYSFYEPLSDVQELFAMCPKGGEGDKCTSSGYVSGLKWTGEWTGTEEGTAKKEMDSKVLSDKKLVLSLKNDGYDSNDCAENYRILDECIYTNDNNAQCDITKECGYKDSGSNKPCKLQGCVGEYDSGTGTCSSGGKNDVEELWGTYSGGCGPGDGDCSPYCASTGQNKYEEFVCVEVQPSRTKVGGVEYVDGKSDLDKVFKNDPCFECKYAYGSDAKGRGSCPPTNT